MSLDTICKMATDKQHDGKYQKQYAVYSGEKVSSAEDIIPTGYMDQNNMIVLNGRTERFLSVFTNPLQQMHIEGNTPLLYPIAQVLPEQWDIKVEYSLLCA